MEKTVPKKTQSKRRTAAQRNADAEAKKDKLLAMRQETPIFKEIPIAQPEMGEGPSTAFRPPRTTLTRLPTPPRPPSTSPTPEITPTPWSYDDMKVHVKNCVEEGKGLK